MNLLLVTISHCFLAKSLTYRYVLFSNTFGPATDYGDRPRLLSYALLNSLQINIDLRHSSTKLDRRFAPIPVHDISLKDTHRKIAPIGPFPTDKIINPFVVKLKLLLSMRIHLMFHVSQITPVIQSYMCPLTDLLLPNCFIDNHPAFSVHCLLDVCHRGRGFQAE